MTAQTPGSVWVIGDLQGCLTPLRALLSQPELAQPDSQFWFAGDLVNRGPDSLGTLRHIIGLGARATSILGNHDLHLLAIAAGFRAPSRSDTLQEILSAPDAPDLIDWLRHRPLLHRAQGHIMVHAGIHPDWTLDQAQALAHEVETALRGPRWREALQGIYGNEPLRWHDTLSGDLRLRVIVNVLTRMRMCTPEGALNFKHKGAPDPTSALQPWFDLPAAAPRNETIVFGHWSTLGLMVRADAICLDTGCVWGRALTALRLQDHHIVRQPCVGGAAHAHDVGSRASR
ncbi:symmetrical bis(5'-nucleosyl)-tetraphosphatase [Alcaligenaceae bacterium CGII-47]|nr:symmetrical bis(5'-nucleosyl)-tetraphosphatase [Alcaligenaceae bacterium CGII-47]